MKMRSVPLAELGKIVSGATPKTGIAEYWNGDIPWVTPADLTDHSGVYFDKATRRITAKGLKSCSANLLPPGSILFSSRAPIGHSAVTSFPLCTNQGFKSIIPGKDLDPVFGFYALKFVTDTIIARGRGATFAEVNMEIMEEAEIPFCDLPEQRRIAAQLEAADRLRRTRRYTLELSDSFLPATFRQLFGDSLRELPRWKPVPISELCESITDCVNKTAPLSEKPTPFKMIRTTNVRNGEVDLNTVRYVSEETFKTWTRRSVPQHGDVILTREAPLGEVGILKNLQNIFLGQRLVQYRANPAKVVPEYLLHALLSTDLQHQLKRLGTGSTVEHIAVPDCETLMVMKPPLAQQQHFATLVTQHERLRATQRESLRQAEHLFQTLLHRAFATP